MELSPENIFLREKFLALVLEDEGKKETEGQNRSPLCDEINKALGVPLGSPYCLGGLQIRGIKRLCKIYDLKNPVPVSASTQKFWKKCNELAPEFCYPKGPYYALKSDICIQQLKSDKTKGHAYTLTQNENATEHQKTFEYNTNKGGSRNGDGCYRLTRTQDGTATKEYLGAVDVISWIESANPQFKIS